MIWKYSKAYYLCRCSPIKLNWKYMWFTHLCPMFNPKTSEDYKKYHENIDLVLNELNKYYCFDNFHVLLYSHIVIPKEKIQELLPTETIIE